MLPNDPQNMGLEYDQPESELSFQDVFRLLIENLWIVLVLCAAALAYAYYEVRNTPVLFKSTGVMEVESNSRRSVLGHPDYEATQRGWYRDPSAMDALAKGVGTQNAGKFIARRVLEQFESGELNDSNIAGWVKNVSGQDEKIDVLAREVLSRVNAKVRERSKFIDVSAVDANPKVARLIAHEAMMGYVEFQKAKREESQTNRAGFLRRQIPDFKKKLDAAEEELASFLRTNTISVGGDDIMSGDLKGLNDRLLTIRADRLQLETDWETLEKVRNDPEKLQLIPSVSRTLTVAELRRKVTDQQNEIVNLQQRYRSKHPKMIEATTLLSSLKTNLVNEVLKAPARLEIELNKLRTDELRLQKTVKEWEIKVTENNVKRREYTRLLEAAQAAKKLYQSAEQRLVEIELTREDKKDDDHLVSAFEAPKLPGVPFQPNKKRIVTTYVGVGLTLSLGIIYLLFMLDTTIKSVDQAERMFGIPVLGSIPRSGDIRGDKQRLILSADPNSLCSEAFRTLRAAIGLLGREEERRVTLFTSAVPSEGKTFCSANFALASANQGRKTLIVDFDLRRPSVGDTFDIPSDQIGVSDCLLGKATLEEAAVVTEYENLHVMPAGSMVPNPSELISSKYTPEFINLAKEKYDQVVLDNAPVTAVSDTLLILHYVDTVCLVSRAAKTSYRLIGRALELIRRGGVTPSGLVLNFVPQRGRSGYYYYYHSDKSYYGGYGPQRKKKSNAAY